MENHCAGLIDIMKQQLEVYRTLLSLADKKKSVLIKGKVPELESIIKEEQVLVLQVGRLEEQRSVLHQALANHFVLSPDELSLSELIKRTDAEESAALQQIFEEMTEVHKNLAEVNQLNSELIKNSLDYINFSLDLLTNTDSTPVYDEQDADKKRNLAKIFDRKI